MQPPTWPISKIDISVIYLVYISHTWFCQVNFNCGSDRIHVIILRWTLWQGRCASLKFRPSWRVGSRRGRKGWKVHWTLRWILTYEPPTLAARRWGFACRVPCSVLQISPRTVDMIYIFLGHQAWPRNVYVMCKYHTHTWRIDCCILHHAILESHLISSPFLLKMEVGIAPPDFPRYVP